MALNPMEIGLHVFKSKGLALSKLREETLRSVIGNFYQDNCLAYEI